MPKKMPKPVAKVMSIEELAQDIQQRAESLLKQRSHIYYKLTTPVGEDDVDRIMRAEQLVEEANDRLMAANDAVNHMCEDILHIQAMAAAIERWCVISSDFGARKKEA